MQLWSGVRADRVHHAELAGDLAVGAISEPGDGGLRVQGRDGAAPSGRQPAHGPG